MAFFRYCCFSLYWATKVAGLSTPVQVWGTCGDEERDEDDDEDDEEEEEEGAFDGDVDDEDDDEDESSSSSGEEDGAGVVAATCCFSPLRSCACSCCCLRSCSCFFCFILRFWNQILTCLSVRPILSPISHRFGRHTYLRRG